MALEEKVRINSIKFTNFKALKQYSVKLHNTNILVGPNNAGKSTIISAFRILDVALKRARRLKPQRIQLPDGFNHFGHRIPEQSINVSLENVSTNYNNDDSQIEFSLTNGNILFLTFPNSGGCILHWETMGVHITTISKFKLAFPIFIQVVPVLGPLEHEEQWVSEDTVKNSLNTHRASRHFRNYWYFFPNGWDKFSHMVSSTWPGMKLIPPELDSSNRKISMFVEEYRITREIYWSGFGFQIWCQLLTHLSRTEEISLVVIDEPEIYLHPDVQRSLLNILRELNSDVLIATHSVEIIGEADPDEIVLINKEKRSSTRLKDIEGIQQAIETLGSAQNITLTHLARTKKIVFVEGENDYKIIRRFAQKLKFNQLAVSNDLTALASGGFASWIDIKSFAWGLDTIKTQMKLFCIYDKDYYCDEQIDFIKGKLTSKVNYVHIHSRKEIENYLLNINVLERSLKNQINIKSKRIQ
ncbi:TPA: AAA family ATPase, partial [Legionella pneumophila]|nr:AAA family ATPase [Legionella pneumophila]